MTQAFNIIDSSMRDARTQELVIEAQRGRTPRQLATWLNGFGVGGAYHLDGVTRNADGTVTCNVTVRFAA